MKNSFDLDKGYWTIRLWDNLEHCGVVAFIAMLSGLIIYLLLNFS